MKARRVAFLAISLVLGSIGGVTAFAAGTPELPLEAANPVKPLPTEPLGITEKLAALPTPPTPETVRRPAVLGRLS